MEFSDKIKELRVSLKMTQESVADLVGVSKSMISLYERGVNKPEWDVLKSLAKLFKVEQGYLIDDAQKMELTGIVAEEKTEYQTRPKIEDRISAVEFELDRLEKRIDKYEFSIMQMQNKLLESSVVLPNGKMSQKAFEKFVENLKGQSMSMTQAEKKKQKHKTN